MDDFHYQPARDHGLPPMQRWRSVQRENGLFEAVLRLGWRAAIRFYLTVYHRLSVEGRENVPAQPPFVLVANHTSHLDMLALSMSLPFRLRGSVLPLAAGDTFFETPALAAFSSAFLNALPLWRRHCGRHALEELRDRLVLEPCAYMLFPEGTRSREGTLLPFKPGLGMMVASTPAPVIPCRIFGAFEALPAGRRLPRPRKLRVRIGQPLRFDETPNTREGWLHIAEKARQAVEVL